MVRTEPKKLTTTDPSTETECRHCTALIRKRREDDSREQIWVSYIGYGRFAFENGDSQWYSRFCPREVAELQGGRRIQHAPPPAVPVHDAEKLERWLES